MKTHELKTWIEPFEAVRDGLKTWEYRQNDRDFQVGDTLILNEGSLATGRWVYTGAQIVAKVSFILYGGVFGVPDDYCIMSLIDVKHSFNYWD